MGSSVANVEQQSINLALRYRYDLSEQLSIGWTETVRDAEGYYNYINGIDTKYQLTDKVTFRAQILRSDTLYPIDLYKEFCDDNSDSAYQDDVQTTLTKNERSVFMKFSYAWLN
ncbi:hypothetical protein GARC_2230 [Paraglaciecola arctica BSs20135]|uniref:Outer membrane protein beta-barrel domain-containing protein n=1 Tax=Paraglaciecola arctica BSs20135 TaxID=493475 RepID=K6YM04_9ALTE|nr:hypothetical protein GARC_2230 [Paraglaciecola arctica BSs20135]